VYFVARRQSLIILLAGGDKQSQASDILAARSLARNIQD
jgi:putative addiction module killer protein